MAATFISIFTWFLLIIVLAGTLFCGIIICYNFFLAAVYMTTNKKVILNILRQIDLSYKKKFYDLGSGSGTVTRIITKRYPEIKCVGIEINPVLYLYSQIRGFLKKDSIEYICKSFHKVNLTDADVIYMFLSETSMRKLAPKLQKELKPGTLVISTTFTIPGKKMKKVLKGKGFFQTVCIYEY